MANIKVTPEELSAQGNDLKSYAEDLKGILDSVEAKVGEIIEGWDGLAQDAYYDMYLEMKKGLDEFPGLVDSLGEATVGAAETFAQVDDELKNAFSKGN